MKQNETSYSTWEKMKPEEVAGFGDKQMEMLFSAILTPHRSLDPKAFVFMMVLIGAFSFITGMYFVSLGAWPVLGFFGLDVLAIYYAFKLNYRSGMMYESVMLSADQMEIKRVFPGGKTETWQCNPYWAKILLQERRGRSPQMSVASQGRSFVFGEFLIPDEKEEFVLVLRNALLECR